MNARWLCLSLIAANTVHAAGEIEYLADLHVSTWEYFGTKTICELRHPVPNYGITRFTLPVGGDLKFWVEAFRPEPKKGTAILHELSPSWLHEEPEESEFSIPLEAGTQPITLAGVHSRWMLNTLARGRMGSFDFKEGEDAWTKVRLSISPVNFQKPYTEFRNCTRRLASAKPETADVHDVLFATDVSALNRKGRANLKRVIKKALAENDVTEVAIRGHADSVGTKGYNQGLSARRAESVSRYLTWNGLQGKKVSVQAYGETRPRQNNASKAGRAANRRVELELIRDPISTATP